MSKNRQFCSRGSSIHRSCGLPRVPGDAILDLARELDIVVLKTELEMFTSCGKLYQAGLRGGRAVNG